MQYISAMTTAVPGTQPSHEELVRDFFKWLPPRFPLSCLTLRLYSDTLGSQLLATHPVDGTHCTRLENERNIAV